MFGTIIAIVIILVAAGYLVYRYRKRDGKPCESGCAACQARSLGEKECGCEATEEPEKEGESQGKA